MKKNKNKNVLFSNKLDNILTHISFYTVIIFSIFNLVANFIPNIKTSMNDDWISALVWLIISFFLTMCFRMFLNIRNISEYFINTEVNSHNKCDIKIIKKLCLIFDELNIHQKIDVFINTDNKIVISELISYFSEKHVEFNLHFDIKIIQHFKNKHIFNNNVFICKNLKHGIKIKFKDTDTGLYNYIFARYNSNFYEYLQITENTFFSSVLNEDDIEFFSIKTKNLFLIDAFSSIIKYNEADNLSLFHDNEFRISSREKFFLNIEDIMKISEKNILCVDLISVEQWLNDFYLGEYIKSHNAIKKNKIERIHVVDYKLLDQKNNSKERIDENVIMYLKFIDLMKKNNVNLMFVSLKEFRFKNFEERGSVIVDECCVFQAINPGSGINYGELSFKNNKVNEYLNRHNYLKTISIKDDEFKIKLEEIKNEIKVC